MTHTEYLAILEREAERLHANYVSARNRHDYSTTIVADARGIIVPDEDAGLRYHADVAVAYASFRAAMAPAESAWIATRDSTEAQS